MLSLAERVIELINHPTETAETMTQYRKPLVGFASAHDSLFDQMKEIIGPHHFIQPNSSRMLKRLSPSSDHLLRRSSLLTEKVPGSRENVLSLM